MEMGFDEKEVIDALRVNNNQQDAAVGELLYSTRQLLVPCPSYNTAGGKWSEWSQGK